MPKFPPEVDSNKVSPGKRPNRPPSTKNRSYYWKTTAHGAKMKNSRRLLRVKEDRKKEDQGDFIEAIVSQIIDKMVFKNSINAEIITLGQELLDSVYGPAADFVAAKNKLQALLDKAKANGA